MAKKSSKAAKILRLKEILALLRKTWTRKMILQYASEKWGVSERTTSQYLSEIHVILAKEFEKEAPNAIRDVVESMDEIYRETFLEGFEKFTEKGEPYIAKDYNAAIQAKMNKAKVLGLLKNQIQFMSMPDSDYSGMTREELDDEWAAASK